MALPRAGRRRVLVSQLEHHSNIVPWQLAGFQVDAAPLTPDGQIDLDAAEEMLTSEHLIVSLAHVSNALGSVLDAKRAAEIAHSKGALLLLDGCQAVPRMPVDVAALGCDFYAFSGHKLYGPTGIGALWGRPKLLDAMPPWQGGGAMIDNVTFERTTYPAPPQRFEAGTPHIVGAIGLHAAVDWVRISASTRSTRTKCALAAESPRGAPHDRRRHALRSRRQRRHRQLQRRRGARARHRHHIGRAGVAVRAGHHCAQPLMEGWASPATARASFAAHSDRCDIEALVRGIEQVKRIFG